MRRRRRKILITAMATVIVVVALRYWCFFVSEMTSDSMEPAIHDRGTPPTHRGDVVISSRYFSQATLRPGQMILLDIPTPTGPVTTIRQIEKITDDHLYFVRALKSMGIDSRQFGAIAKKDIKGKVVWIIRESY